MAEQGAAGPWTRFFLYGLGSGVCYALLFAYLNDRSVMGYFVRSDGWYPLLPVASALVFSYFHGGFTGYFWEVLGVTAKAARPVPQEKLDEAEGSED
jgi:hypothetical protein